MERRRTAWVMGAVALTGAGLGGWAFGDTPARAQPTAFRECFTARHESVETGNDGMIQQPDLAHTVLIPPGWTVVAGGGYGGLGTVLLCR